MSNIIIPDNNVIPTKDCKECALSNSRIVDFQAIPVLKPGRILIVNEYPSLDSLQNSSPNIFMGHTWNVIARVFDYLQLDPDYFSYTTIVRCWRTKASIDNEDVYNTCKQYIEKAANLIESPLIVTLGVTPVKYLLNREITYSNEVFIGLKELRKWEKPYNSIYNIPLVPMDHPQNVRLVACHSQLYFRNIVTDFMRTIKVAKNYSSYYNEIWKSMYKSTYLADYENYRKLEAQKHGQ